MASCPYAEPVKNPHYTEVTKKRYDTKKPRAVEKELKNILKEIRVISNKIRNKVNFT